MCSSLPPLPPAANNKSICVVDDSGEPSSLPPADNRSICVVDDSGEPSSLPPADNKSISVVNDSGEPSSSQDQNVAASGILFYSEIYSNT